MIPAPRVNGDRVPRILGRVAEAATKCRPASIARILFALSLALAGAGCRGPASRVAHGPPIDRIDGEPTMRVRTHPRRERVELSAPGTVRAAAGKAGMRYRFPDKLEVLRRDGVFILRAGERGWRWRARWLRVAGSDEGPLRIDGEPYPGELTLRARSPERFAIVNRVGLERYVAAVASAELYPAWPPGVYATQTIAARTYALWQAHQRRDKAYDLRSDQLSQVYGGEASEKARKATRATRGRVLVYGRRVLPAFYSAVCGGASQRARAIFPNAPEIPPLAATRRAGHCRASPDYRWGPIRRSRARLARRLAAWGRARGRAIARLRGLDALRVAARNQASRPTRFHVGGLRRAYELTAEELRFAANFAADGLEKPATPLPSSHVTPAVHGDTAVFRDGRGLGHGVGLCQWGAKALVEDGIAPADVAARFYPGARVTRLY